VRPDDVERFWLVVFFSAIIMGFMYYFKTHAMVA
jgi:hypothetical protein